MFFLFYYLPNLIKEDLYWVHFRTCSYTIPNIKTLINKSGKAPLFIKQNILLMVFWIALTFGAPSKCINWILLFEFFIINFK